MGWHELPDEDQPPERIWLDSEALNEHFEQVHARIKSGSNGEPVETVPLMQNELTKGLRDRG